MLARNQHIRVGGAHAREQVQDRPHGRRFRDQRGPAFRPQQAIFRLQALPLAQGAAQLNLRPQNRDEAGIVPGLLNEIPRAAPHRLHRQTHTSPGRHDHDGKRAVHGLQDRKGVQAFLAGGRVARKVEVHQDEIEVLRLYRRHDPVGRGGGFG